MSASVNIIKEMLLIENPSVFRLYNEMNQIAKVFLIPAFVIAATLEFLGELNFFGVLKKLVISFVFMAIFYNLHVKAVDVALTTANSTLKKVSPTNLFVKKWYEPKVRTSNNKAWGLLEKLAVPNLNDLLATAFFLLSKVFIWLLKLIYSSVYHFTYIFSGITAVLFMFGWTQDAFKGTIQASLWCMILPFVVVAILALIGNSVEDNVSKGGFLVSSIDHLLWLFGVTLLLLISPAITMGMVKGDGLHSVGSKMGTMVTRAGFQAYAMAPMLMRVGGRAQNAYHKAKSFGSNVVSKGVSTISQKFGSGASNASANQNATAIHSHFSQNKNAQNVNSASINSSIANKTNGNVASNTTSSKVASNKIVQNSVNSKLPKYTSPSSVTAMRIENGKTAPLSAKVVPQHQRVSMNSAGKSFHQHRHISQDHKINRPERKMPRRKHELRNI